MMLICSSKFVLQSMFMSLSTEDMMKLLGSQTQYGRDAFVLFLCSSRTVPRIPGTVTI